MIERISCSVIKKNPNLNSIKLHIFDLKMVIAQNVHHSEVLIMESIVTHTSLGE